MLKIKLWKNCFGTCITQDVDNDKTMV